MRTISSLARNRHTLQANGASCLLAMVSRRSLVQLAEILLHQLLLLSNKLCACLVPRRRCSQPMRGERRVRLTKVRWANMGCRASKSGRELVVMARVMVVMRCGSRVEG